MLHLLGSRRVRIDGLSARPDLNGATGTAVDFLGDRRRYAIQLDNAAPGTKPLSVGMDKVHRLLSDEELSLIPLVAPSADLFALYCKTYPLSLQDGAFQAKHLHLAAAVDLLPDSRDVLVRAFPMRPCLSGCPECIFGTCCMELHPAQREHPAIKEWVRVNDEHKNTPTAGPKLPPAEAPPLRFSVGDQVLCHTGQGPTDVSAGQVVKQFYGIDGEEPTWPEGFWVPYQVRLTYRRHGGHVEAVDDLIFAPVDTDHVIRRMPTWRHGGIFCCESCAMEHNFAQMDDSGSVLG